MEIMPEMAVLPADSSSKPPMIRTAHLAPGADVVSGEERRHVLQVGIAVDREDRQHADRQHDVEDRHFGGDDPDGLAGGGGNGRRITPVRLAMASTPLRASTIETNATHSCRRGGRNRACRCGAAGRASALAAARRRRSAA